METEILPYEQAIEKENIKRWIIKNYPKSISTPKMRRSLNNFSYKQLLELKIMFVNNK
jgi:hypothetical protein|tara:strand:+ start:1759 stop:1932 length:174 start_codon:yes stop_codon:yes gene_type:complete